MVKYIRIMYVGCVAGKVEGRGASRVLLGTLEGNRPSGARCCKGEDGIKIDLQEIILELHYSTVSENMASGGLL